MEHPKSRRMSSQSRKTGDNPVCQAGGGTMIRIAAAMLAVLASCPALAGNVGYFAVPSGAHPHDVAAAPDGTVWYTAQNQGALGILDPKTGKFEQVSLGKGAAPHGVIVGPD